jgi:ProP effector
MSGSESKPLDPHHAVLISLRSTFPVFQECRPLAIGIHKAVLDRIPDINPQQLRLAMRMHTSSARYLKALTNCETRFDLNGNAAGPVTPEQKQQALDTLRERFRKGAEQHKARLLALQQKQLRQKKLIRLAEKFNAQ